MIIKPFDVCLVANYSLRQAHHDRTCIAIAIMREELEAYPTSASQERCIETIERPFKIDIEDPRLGF